MKILDVNLYLHKQHVQNSMITIIAHIQCYLWVSLKWGQIPYESNSQGVKVAYPYCDINEERG